MHVPGQVILTVSVTNLKLELLKTTQQEDAFVQESWRGVMRQDSTSSFSLLLLLYC